MSLKLQNVAYSYGLNTYQNIIKSIRGASMEALGEQRKYNNKNITNEWWNEDTEKIIV